MKHSRTRRLSTLMVALAAVAAVLFGLVSPASAATPYCGVTWGSLAKTQVGGDRNFITDIGAGRHACYDRLVISMWGEDSYFGSYDVRYVPEVLAEGSGAAVPLRGGAALQVVVKAQIHEDPDTLHPPYTPANRQELVNVRSFSTFRQVAWASTFEGRTTLGLGVRARLPFRVFILAGAPDSDQSPRLVIDVAHRW